MTDNFNGDNAALIRSIDALLALDKAKALAPHGIGGHARQMLTAAATRLTAAQAEADRLRTELASANQELARFHAAFKPVNEDDYVDFPPQF